MTPDGPEHEYEYEIEVSPADLVYLQPTAPDPATTPADGTSDAGSVAGLGDEAVARDTDGAWSTIKPLLESAAP